MIYKLSAQTEAEIKAYLVEITEADEWQQYLSNRSKGIHNCVYLGKLTDKPAKYNEDGNVITDQTYFDGYHADVMTDNELDVPKHIKRHNPEHPKHNFA